MSSSSLQALVYLGEAALIWVELRARDLAVWDTSSYKLYANF